MKKEKAIEIFGLLEEIRKVEYLAAVDEFHSLEFIAEQLKKVKPFQYPRTSEKLHHVEEVALKFIRTEISTIADELNKKLENDF